MLSVSLNIFQLINFGLFMLIQMSNNIHFLEKFLVTYDLYLALKLKKEKLFSIHKLIPVSLGCPQNPDLAFTTSIWVPIGYLLSGASRR